MNNLFKPHGESIVRRAAQDSHKWEDTLLRVCRTDAEASVSTPDHKRGRFSIILQGALQERTSRLVRIIEKIRKKNYPIDSKKISIKMLEDVLGDFLARKKSRDGTSFMA